MHSISAQVKVIKISIDVEGHRGGGGSNIWHILPITIKSNDTKS